MKMLAQEQIVVFIKQQRCLLQFKLYEQTEDQQNIKWNICTLLANISQKHFKIKNVYMESNKDMSEVIY